MRTLENWIDLEKKKFPNLEISPKELNTKALEDFGVSLKSYESALLIFYDSSYSYSRKENPENHILSVLTDQAFYLLDRTIIPFQTLVSGILYTSPIGKSQITLLTDETSYNLSGPMSRNSISSIQNLGMFLDDLQVFYRLEHTEIKRAFLKNLQIRLALSRVSFHEMGLLSDEGRFLVEVASSYPELKKEATMLSLEECYRMGDNDKYLSMWNEKKRSLPEEIRERLRYPDEVFADRFLLDLSNEFEQYLTQYLIRTYQNLKENHTRTRSQSLQYLYLLIRMEDWPNYFKEFNDLAREMSSDEIRNLLVFQARFQNEKMCQTYMDLVDGKRVSYPSMEFTDSLGFSALHYAMILRDEDAVSRLLEEKKWSDITLMAKVEEDVRDALDYVFMAVYLFPDYSIAREIFLSTSHTAKLLLRSLRSLEFHIEMSRKSSKALFDQLREKRNAGDEDGLRLIRDKIDELAERIEQLNHSQEEIEQGLEKLFHDKIESCNKKRIEILNSGSPLARYILKIAEDKDSLYELLYGSIDSYKVYRDGNFTFVATTKEELPYTYYEYNRRQIVSFNVKPGEDVFVWDSVQKELYESENRRIKDQEEKKRRFYEEKRRKENESSDSQPKSSREKILGRWFSSTAMENPDALRREYRALVKKYHPDENLEDTTLIMQEIQQEKDSIRQLLRSSM